MPKITQGSQNASLISGPRPSKGSQAKLDELDVDEYETVDVVDVEGQTYAHRGEFAGGFVVQGTKVDRLVLSPRLLKYDLYIKLHSELPIVHEGMVKGWTALTWNTSVLVRRVVISDEAPGVKVP